MWWLLGSAFAADPSLAEDRRISVATLNAWGLPSPVARDRRGRMPLIERWLSERSYDLAGLEEVWQGARRWFTLTDLLFPEQDGDSGLAIRTEWPVSRTVAMPFVAERGIDGWKAKGLLAAEVMVDTVGVMFGVTHLQAGGGARNAVVREAQVREILAALEGADDVPVVLLGDFNLYDGQPTDEATRAVLEEAGFVDVASATGTLDGTYPGLPHRFDRVFVRPSATVDVVPEACAVVGKGLSDHHAVEATLRVDGRR